MCVHFVFEDTRGDSLFSVRAYQKRNLCVWALKCVLILGEGVGGEFSRLSLFQKLWRQVRYVEKKSLLTFNSCVIIFKVV